MLQALKKLPYKVDISILVAICLITVAQWAYSDITSYRGGLQNSPSWGSFQAFLLCEPLKIIAVLFAIIRSFFHLGPGQMRKRCITTALLSILLFAGSWILRPAETVFFLWGSEKWVRQNVDIDAIQTWLLSEKADKYSGQRYRLDFPNELPSFLTDFDPKFIIFHEHESEKGKCIEFGWGGGLVSWGFVVGSPEMKAKQEGRVEHTRSYVEHRRPIRPGVYVFEAG